MITETPIAYQVATIALCLVAALAVALVEPRRDRIVTRLHRRYQHWRTRRWVRDQRRRPSPRTTKNAGELS
jgi:hypothetical protein